MSVMEKLIKHAQKSNSPMNYRMAGTWVVLDEDSAKEMGKEGYFSTTCQAFKSMDSKAMQRKMDFARSGIATYKGKRSFDHKGNWLGLGYGEFIIYDLQANEVIMHEVVQ